MVVGTRRHAHLVTADGFFSCLFLTAPSADFLARVVDGLRPDFEAWTEPRDECGSVRTFVVRAEPSVSRHHMPEVARRAAMTAYALGATRVEYFNEAMDGHGPRLIKHRHPIAATGHKAGDSLPVQPPLFGGDRDDRFA